MTVLRKHAWCNEVRSPVYPVRLRYAHVTDMARYASDDTWIEQISPIWAMEKETGQRESRLDLFCLKVDTISTSSYCLFAEAVKSEISCKKGA
jgi:hypothetical protein